MTKDDVAAALDEIGTLLELKGENTFRCNAYHTAARSISSLAGDLKALVESANRGTSAASAMPCRRRSPPSSPRESCRTWRI